MNHKPHHAPSPHHQEVHCCPNNLCSCHWPTVIKALATRATRWYVKNGFYSSSLKGRIQRYRCKICGIHFSTQSFRNDYYSKRSIDLKAIAQELTSCCSMRSICRKFNLSLNSVSLAYMKLARQNIACEVEIKQRHTLSPQTVIIDGFESFVHSQYEPNNINLGVTEKGRFILEMNYAHLNRKGRMRKQQKQLAAYYKQAYPLARGHLRQKIAELVKELLGWFPTPKITIWSDEKREYREPLEQAGVRHRRISSKEARTYQNPLYPVNQVDKMFRKDLSEHVRETQCWGKDANCQMERMEIYRGYYNYEKPYLVNSPKSKRTYHHSDEAGIPREVVEVARAGLYERRRFVSHVYDRMSMAQRQLWFRMLGRPGTMRQRYLPKYMRDYASMRQWEMDMVRRYGEERALKMIS